MEFLGASLQSLYQEHINLMSFPAEKYADGSIVFHPPYVNSNLLCQILDYATKIFANEPLVMDIEYPVYIVGDLHGHLFDLYRIFQNHGLPPKSNYLFLGDFVDRGVYSTELVILVLVIKILFPKNIFIIRGNHEFIPTNGVSAFSDEIEALYKNFYDIKNRFYNLFSNMPLAAKIAGYICMHGGLSPNLHTLDQISNLHRPIIYASDIVEGITWSDPKPEQTFEFFNSPRGHGFYFSEKALDDFLNNNKLKGLIRGHLFVDGLSSIWEGKCITVFSASNYVPGYDSSCGILYFDEKGEMKSVIYSGLETPARTKKQKLQVSNSTSMFNPTASTSSFIPRMMKLAKITKTRHTNTLKPQQFPTSSLIRLGVDPL